MVEYKDLTYQIIRVGERSTLSARKYVGMQQLYVNEQSDEIIGHSCEMISLFKALGQSFGHKN